MLDGNWRSNLADIGRIAVAVWVGFASGYWVAGPQAVRQEGDRRVEQRGTGDDNKPSNASPPQGESPSSYKQPNCDRPKNKEESLYCEVRRLADATEKAQDTNWSAWFQFGASTIAVLVAAWAALEARKAAKAALAAAKVAQASLRHTAKLGRANNLIANRSANASIRSANAAEHALRALERPYLSIEKIDTEELRHFFEKPRPSIAYTVVNYGKTPAFFQSISARLQFKPEGMLEVPDALKEEFFAVVPPSQRLPRAMSADDSATIEVEGAADYRRFQGEEAVDLIFHGRICYESGDGFLYVDGFALKATADAKSFIPMGGSYNYRRSYDLRENKPDQDGE